MRELPKEVQEEDWALETRDIDDPVMFMQGRAAALLWRSTAIFLKRTAAALQKLGLMEASLLLFNGSKTQGKHNVVLTYSTAAAPIYC